jgi:hypothetical protein
VAAGGWLSAPNVVDQRRRLRAEGVEIDGERVIGGVP